MMYRLNPTHQMNQLNANLIMNPKPPTLYALMNSIVNYGKEEQTKIRDLASECHSDIFDFEYDLSEFCKTCFFKNLERLTHKGFVGSPTYVQAVAAGKACQHDLLTIVVFNHHNGQCHVVIAAKIVLLQA